MGVAHLSLPAGVIIGLFVSMAAFFATVQAIWVDETTQLSGLALGFQEQLLWLIGRSDVELGVPADRMPPLSYWLGSAWAGMFGLSELSMRWFGIVAVLAGAPALYLAGHHVAGWRGGLFCLAFVLLSPNMLIQAVEIRAYPLFFAFCVWACWCFAKLVVDHDAREARPRSRTLILLAVFVLAAAYTHFYGLVFGVCLLGALLIDRLLRGWPLMPLLGVGGAAVVLSLGIVPFVLAAVSLTSGGASTEAASPPFTAHLAETLRDTVRLAVRTIMHGSHFIYLAAAGMVGLGALFLAVMVLLRRGTCRERAILIAPLVLAFPLLGGLSLLISSFKVLAPHYNLWMVPLVAIFLSRAFIQEGSGWRPRTLQIAGVVAVLGHLIASGVFLSNARYFTHGPGEWVANSISDPARTLVIHDGNGLWGQVYFPVHFMTDGVTTQLLLQPNEKIMRLTPKGIHPVGGDKDELFSRFDTVLQVSVQVRDTQFLKQKIRQGETCGGREIPKSFKFGDYLGSEFYCAYASATLLRLERKSE